MIIACQPRKIDQPKNKDERRIVNYYSNGEKKSIETFNIKSSKKCTELFFENGQLMRKYYMINDTLEGPYEIFYEDGLPESQFNYSKGEIDGVLKSYHPNGKIDVISNYKDGKRHGEKRFIEKQAK